jgi:hypothetical protein
MQQVLVDFEAAVQLCQGVSPSTHAVVRASALFSPFMYAPSPPPAEFYVHDSNGPVKDAKKLAAIEKVLNINFETEDAHLAASGVLPHPS